MVNNVCGIFVSQKINKIRWKPDNLSDMLISGSWDDEENKISLWQLSKTGEGDESYVKLKLRNSVDYAGDVMEMKFIDMFTFVVSSSFGSISLYRISYQNEEARLDLLHRWDRSHIYQTGNVAAGTDVTCFEDNVISVGEDGRIILISIKEEKPYRVIENADSCTIRCVSVNKMNEVLTGNSRGQMKIWDLRNYSNVPETSFTLTGGQVGFTRVVCHPTQTHIKLAGGEDGTITVWDLRNNKYSVNSVNAHSQLVSELMFHPDRPEHLFSCSSNGQLWHWDSSKLTRSQITQFSSTKSENFTDILEEGGCPWMSKNLKNRITVYSLIQNLPLPINSLDVQNNFVVCSCDNEAIYLINDFSAS